MLGNGRPFVLELVNPKPTLATLEGELAALEAAVNADKGKNTGLPVTAKHFVTVGQEVYSELQAGSEGKRKHYCAVVWVSKGIQRDDLDKLAVEDLEIMQKTPVRVVHRRPLLVRPRTVYTMKAEWLSNHFFILRLTTSAGFYIKEFVHGDLGRTSPSIPSLLGCRADILQLDVMGVDDKWGKADGAPPPRAKRKPSIDMVDCEDAATAQAKKAKEPYCRERASVPSLAAVAGEA
ncbi:unnamed protein product [Chrysoparadoxa australica]